MMDEETRSVLKDSIESCFMTPGFTDMWPRIKRLYADMGFTDRLSDQETISEYKFVYEQLRKYIGSHYEQVMRHMTDWNGMFDEVKALAEKAPEPAQERRSIVYACLRNEWLMGLLSQIAMNIEIEKDEDDE